MEFSIWKWLRDWFIGLVILAGIIFVVVGIIELATNPEKTIAAVNEKEETPIGKEVEFLKNYEPYNQTLSRDEQMVLMKECIEDAGTLSPCARSDYKRYGGAATIAAAFFEYRTKGR